MSLDLQDPTMAPLPERAVLDTNVVLDAWWFDDPATRTLRGAIEAGRLRWLLTAAMVVEARDVLERPPFASHSGRCERVLFGMIHLAEHQGEPGGTPSLRCRDPDDQIFLDLAVSVRPCWLLSKRPANPS